MLLNYLSISNRLSNMILCKYDLSTDIQKKMILNVFCLLEQAFIILIFLYIFWNALEVRLLLRKYVQAPDFIHHTLFTAIKIVFPYLFILKALQNLMIPKRTTFKFMCISVETVWTYNTSGFRWFNLIVFIIFI